MTESACVERVVVPQGVLDSIRNTMNATRGPLYGRNVTEEGLTQILGLEEAWRDRHLDQVGEWRRLEDETGGNEEDDLVLFVSPEAVAGRHGQMTVSVETYDTNNYHSRYRALAITEGLSQKKVALVGVGSIGTKVARELAKHGVELLVFDPETVEIENPYRLGLGTPPELLIGRNKCAACKDDIHLNLPASNVYAFPFDVAESPGRFSEALTERRPDVIVLSADTADGIATTNAQARRMEIPVIHIALSDGAESGQIHMITGKSDDPCLLCMQPPADISVVRSPSLRPYAEDLGDTQRGVPALSVDTTIIASLATKIVLAFLATGDATDYFTQMGNRGQIMWFSTTPNTWVMEDFAQKIVASVLKTERCPGCWTPDVSDVVGKYRQRKDDRA